MKKLLKTVSAFTLLIFNSCATTPPFDIHAKTPPTSLDGNWKVKAFSCEGGSPTKEGEYWEQALKDGRISAVMELNGSIVKGVRSRFTKPKDVQNHCDEEYYELWNIDEKKKEIVVSLTHGQTKAYGTPPAGVDCTAKIDYQITRRYSYDVLNKGKSLVMVTDKIGGAFPVEGHVVSFCESGRVRIELNRL